VANPGQGATLRILPLSSTIQVGQDVTVCVFAENINDIYGIDLQILFNGQVIQIQDADPNRLGVNITPRELPDFSGGQGIVTANDVSLGGNTISYAGSRISPATGQSGSGVVLAFVARGAVPGVSNLQFNSIQMLKQNLSPVPLANSFGAVINVVGGPPIGAASGKFVLQGRTTHADTHVTMGNASSVTDQSGTYGLINNAGTYNVLATKAKYLPSILPNVAIQTNGLAALPIAALRGGDANNDGTINLFDLVLVAANYDQSPPSNPAADVNDDGSVDVIDLVLVGSNYGYSGVQQGFSLKSSTELSAIDSMHKSAGAVARVSTDAPNTVKAGDEFKVAVRVNGAKGLFGAQVAVNYDPSHVTLVGKDGVAGDLLPNAYVGTNKVGDSAGSFRYAATRLNPDKAVDGDGTLVTLTFRALTDGAPNILVSEARLADAEANALPAKIAPGGK